MKFSRSLSMLIAVVMVTSALYGGGWQINEHGARAMGFGGAWASRALDLSAMYSNAAGLTNMKGINVMLGGTLIMPSSKFKGPGAGTTVTEMESQTFFPPNLYGSYQINDQWFVGLGIYAPFGLGTKWPANWVGRSLSINSEMQVIAINPTVAYKFNDKLSFGAGVSILMGSVNLSYKPLAPLNEGLVALDADASTAVSFNIGVLYQFNDKLSVGASYRTLADVEFKGKLTATGMGAAQGLFPGGDGNATLPMPSNLQVGAAYKVLPELVVALEYQMVGWSAYEELKLNVPTGPPVPAGAGFPPQLVGIPLQRSTTQIQKWEDGHMFRFGAEYTLNDKIMLRAGFVMDNTPQPVDKMEPRLPDWDKKDLTLGAGYKVNEQITVDVAYMMILTTERYGGPATFNGLYTSGANLFAANVSYAF
ncbi:MAG: outer membrane protein transport protein [Bacteroidetes bacterium]|jgi:long-chain fatty acid transport protein|nr:outer membrane protein transport protein [Bacteroidota bacterium]